LGWAGEHELALYSLAWRVLIVVIVYTLLKGGDPAKQLWPGSAGAAILSSVAMTATVVCVVVFSLQRTIRYFRDSCSILAPFRLWYYAAGSMAVLISSRYRAWIRRALSARSVADVVMCAVRCRDRFSTL